jgi:glc operon protein GlcG
MTPDRLSFLTAAALVVLYSSAFSQGKPAEEKSDQIEAGTTAKGLPKAQERPMTVEIAKQLVAAAKKSSCSPPTGACSGAFAIVDDAGVLIYLEIIDGVLAGGPDLAIKKAKTSALWRRPTQVFQDAVNNKTNTSYAGGTFSDMTTSPGGVPIVKNGRMVGGVGIAAVGQATKQIDDAILAEAAKIFGPQW